MSTLAVNILTDSAGTGSPTFTNKIRGDFILSPTTITASYTVPTGFNAMTAGPVEIANGVEITVSNNSEWTVV